MENAIMNTGTIDLELSAADMEMLKDIAREGATNFVGLKKEGLQIGQEFYNEIFCQIMRIDRYSYKWEGGTSKVINRDMTRDEAKAAGYAEGMDLSLRIMKPEMEEEFTLSMPQSSVWNFSKYVAYLLSKSVHPKMVVTKIKITLKQFKVGSPVAVATFDSAGMIQPENGPVNVTPKEDGPAPQPVKAPVETPQQAEIPQEWA
jgi:hypothetical protein